MNQTGSNEDSSGAIAQTLPICTNSNSVESSVSGATEIRFRYYYCYQRMHIFKIHKHQQEIKGLQKTKDNVFRHISPLFHLLALPN